MGSLLAVDLGLKTGLALYGKNGRLIWYRSHNFGTAARLKRGIRIILNSVPDCAWLVLEGGGSLADIWKHEAARRRIAFHQISAEQWRKMLLYPREHRSRSGAKKSACGVAKRIIEWSGAPRPTTLRHDTAEAIIIGLWGTMFVGWLKNLPAELKR